MKCPSRVTQLVEQTGTHTCSEYFFLHLIQDINDLTTITNKTFEEAVLIIHTLIDRLMDERMSLITLLKFGNSQCSSVTGVSNAPTPHDARYNRICQYSGSRIIRKLIGISVGTKFCKLICHWVY